MAHPTLLIVREYLGRRASGETTRRTVPFDQNLVDFDNIYFSVLSPCITVPFDQNLVDFDNTYFSVLSPCIKEIKIVE